MKGLGRGWGEGQEAQWPGAVARATASCSLTPADRPGQGQGFPDDEEGQDIVVFFPRCIWESVPSSAGLPRLRLPPQSPTLTKGPLPFKARLSLLTQKPSQAPGGTFHNPAHQGQNSLLSWPLLRETSGPERLSSIPFHSSDRSGTGHPCNPRSKARSPGRVLGLCCRSETLGMRGNLPGPQTSCSPCLARVYVHCHPTRGSCAGVHSPGPRTVLTGQGPRWQKTDPRSHSHLR